MVKVVIRGIMFGISYITKHIFRKEDAIRREKRLKDDGRARYQLMERAKESIHGLK